MNKYLITTTIMALLLVSVAIAQNVPAPQARIKTLGVIGEGIAISAGNPADFKVVKIGLAKIGVTIAGTESELNAGILYLDSDNYAVKNAQWTNGTATGDIYLNNTQVGSFSANLVPKPRRDVWYGTITVNGVSYNTYMVAAQRAVKASEAADNIKDYCKENPAKCGTVANAVKGIGNTCDKLDSTSCRDKIVDYCTKNPTDSRCVAVFRAYCAKNTNDSRCLAELKLFCSKNPRNPNCVEFCNTYPKACAIIPAVPATAVTNANATAGETETGTTITG